MGGSVRFCSFENTKVPDTSWLYNGDYISAIDMMYLKDWVFSDNVFRNIRGANGGGLIRGRISGEGEARSVGNVTGELNGYFVNPALGDLHLTKRATGALGKGVQLPDVRYDIDSQKRKKHPDVGADQR